MEARIIFQGKNDPPQLEHLVEPVLDMSSLSVMTFVLIEDGMVSGEPSVLIVSETMRGSVVLQTSFDKFLTVASTMASAAEERWGWELPEGHATIMPPSREAYKAMLEQIKKELEEWDEAEEA